MRLLRLALPAVALAAGSAGAQGAPATYRFVKVDELRSSRVALVVKGVIEGEAAAREVELGFDAGSTISALENVELRRSCEGFLLLAMERPGAYQVVVSRNGPSVVCALSRTGK